MFDRILTGIALIFLVYLFLFYTDFYIFYTILSILFLYAFYEWLSLANVSNPRKMLYLLFLLITMVLSFSYIYPFFIITFFYLALVFWALITIMLKNYKSLINIMHSYHLVIGFFIFYTCWLSIVSINNLDNTLIFEIPISSDSVSRITINHFLFIITLVSLSDISGYIFGRIFGNKKLIESISPNKTIEGFIASIFVPTLLFYLYFIEILSYDFFLSDLVFIIIFCAACTIGDLAISSFKRAFEAKDSGKFLPGHGGLLDRLDSYLPSVFIYQFWMFL